jgi:hypothetical protein
LTKHLASFIIDFMEDFKKRPLHFAHAWPLKNWRKDGTMRVAPPFKDAEPWQCSVYYYWWAYLRRHDGYRSTCEQAGKGHYAKLYDDFGDVHATDFWTWWQGHSWIFAEPAIRQVQLAEAGDISDERTLTIRVPLETKLSLITGQFKRLVRPQLKLAARAKLQSRAKYPVATKPVLSALHEHLMVWDAKQRHPYLRDADLADIVQLRINNVVDGETMSTRKSLGLSTMEIEQKIYRRKQLAVQRHLRIAEQYISNLGQGQFPLRDKR